MVRQLHACTRGHAAPRARVTVERKGPAFARRNSSELRPGRRQARKENQNGVSGLDPPLARRA
ncbi:MAG: hypothetical protein DMF98_07535 [Acidobacteria bacterium]|nr:MAG: hypothetical protein DMF98_07535 [Acidobacteriota bacterium]